MTRNARAKVATWREEDQAGFLRTHGAIILTASLSQPGAKT